MSKPEKLIVVGMRFMSTNAAGCISELQKGSRVNLIRQPNPKGINGVAYGVYDTVEGTQIGWVRNIDIPDLEKTFHGDIYGEYILTTKQQNYLVLMYSPTYEANKWVDKYDNGMLNIKKHTDEYKADFTNTNKRETKMNTSEMRNSFFREMKNAVIDITTGTFGITTKDGICVFKDGVVSVNPLVEMGVKVPAFAIRVEVSTLAEGDIIVNNDEVNFFKAKTKDGYEVVGTDGVVKQVGSISNIFFGKNTVLAVKNIMGSSGINPMMLAMMAGDGGKFDMKTFAMMSMMGGASGGTGMDSNMLMMMMLMDK